MFDPLLSPKHYETVGTAAKRLQVQLADVSESAALDAQVLLAQVLGQPRAWILAHPEHTLSRDQQESLHDAETRLLDGVPLPYVLGEWEFYKLPFLINQNVLIPRPETEMLVEMALQWLGERGGEAQILDIGAGSGCIAVSLAVNRPGAFILAGDVSKEALRLAHTNVDRHKVQGQVGLLQMDVMDGIPGRFDLIVANLPYIPSDSLAGLVHAEHEPVQALDGGADGLDFIRRLLEVAPRSLIPGGCLLAEFGAGQSAAVIELGRRHFPDARVSVLPDLAGMDRALRIDT